MVQGLWCRWTVCVVYFCLLGASSRMVGGIDPLANGDVFSLVVRPLFGLLCSSEQGQECCLQNVVYSLLMSFNAGIIGPALVVQAPRWPLETYPTGQCESVRNGVW